MDENHPCPSCKFYRKKSQPSNLLVGFCHRYPRTYSQGYYNIVEVKSDDWCGEWVANEEYLKLQYGGIK